MNVWLSSQAVARLTDLLASVAAAPHTSQQQRGEADRRRSQVEELMPASEMLVLAGVLREASGRAELSAATRADCWSWSSYLERLLATRPTPTAAATTQPVRRARPERNAVLVPGERSPAAVASLADGCPRRLVPLPAAPRSVERTPSPPGGPIRAARGRGRAAAR
jgi:hypothetical protein